MSNQLTLEREAKKLYHKNDPDTSKDAAIKTLKKLGEQQREVLDAIRKYYSTGDFTAKELAMRMARNQLSDYRYYYYLVQRRLNELADYIERTGGRRNGCAVWRLK